MRAMILAAGLATRLLPLSNSRPKALVPLRGVTMLDFWIERLMHFGFEEVFINAYHLKDLLSEAVLKRRWPKPVRILKEQVLLGTGGGMRNAAEYLDNEPFAVINVDIVCDVDLRSLYERHKLSGGQVTLLLHDWPEFNHVAVNEGGFVLGFGREAREIQKKDCNIKLMAFTGIHLINPAALAEASLGAPANILDIYRGLIAKGKFPVAAVQQELFWREMGTVGSYGKLSTELAQLEPGRIPPLATGDLVSIDAKAVIHPDCVLRGSVVAGSGVRICEGVTLENVILWDDIKVEKGSTLKNCIVADGMNISGSHSDKVFAPV